MSSSENSYIKLWDEIKKYFSLQIEYAKLSATEKLTIILTAIAVIGVALILGGMALLYLSFALVYLIESWIGSTAGAYLIVSVIILVILAIILMCRKKLILNPIARFISKLFLDPQK